MAVGQTVHIAKRISASMQATNAGIVGEVKSTVLTESEFSTLMGAEASKWKLCNGQSCVGTAYATATSRTTVPDMRGRFMRMLDPTDAVDPDGSTRSIGDTQGDETAINSLKLNVRVGGTNNDLWHDSTHQVAGAANYEPAEYQNANALRGGDETRPKNVAVNYFIKTDW